MAAADAVDLQLVAGAHDTRKQPVAQGRIAGQIFAAEVGSARSSAAHQHTRYFRHI